MRWQRRGRSRHIEDRRAQGGRPGVRIGGIGGPRGKLGLGGLVVVLLLAWFVGIDPMLLLAGGGLAPGGTGSDPNAPIGAPPADVGAAGPARSDPAEEELVEFVSFVIDDLQQTWTQLLPGYRPARLVLFRGATRSGCGVGQSEMGPFYCPRDEKVYIDLAFFEELRRRFGAPGDFAQAYVLAHEIGHHVQRLGGVEERVRAEQRASPRRANELSVRMELQADCLAGVWGQATLRRGILEPGDVEEGLRAAAAIGDDQIQRQSGGGVHPESFTHGSSEQRVRWLRQGLDSGDPGRCDTFAGAVS